MTSRALYQSDASILQRTGFNKSNELYVYITNPAAIRDKRGRYNICLPPARIARRRSRRQSIIDRRHCTPNRSSLLLACCSRDNFPVWSPKACTSVRLRPNWELDLHRADVSSAETWLSGLSLPWMETNQRRDEIKVTVSQSDIWDIVGISPEGLPLPFSWHRKVSQSYV